MRRLVHHRGWSVSHRKRPHPSHRVMHAGVAGDPCGSGANANEHRLLGTGAVLREESCCLSVGLMLPLETKHWLFISWSSPLVLAFLRRISHAVHGGLLPSGGAQPRGQLFASSTHPHGSAGLRWLVCGWRALPGPAVWASCSSHHLVSSSLSPET